MRGYTQRPGVFLSQHIKYKQVGLVAYEVVGIEDMLDLERQLKLAQYQAGVLRRAARLSLGVESRPRKRVIGKQNPRDPHKRRKIGGDGDFWDPLGILGVNLGGDGGDRVGSVGDNHEEHDAASADSWSDRCPSDSLDSLDEFSPGHDTDADSVDQMCGDSETDQSEGIFYDVGTGHVWSAPPNAEGRECLGRISVIKTNTPQEAMSVYCSRHGCGVMKRMHRCPSHEAVLAWFVEGQSIPKGRVAAFVGKHKGKFLAADN